MLDKLRLNTKLFSFGGVIGRRDFVLNYLYLLLIYTAFSLPFSFWIISNMKNYTETFAINNLFANSPLMIKFFLILGLLIVIVPHFFNVFKRVNDISGKENLIINIIISTIFLLSLCSVFFPSPFSFLLSFIFLVLFLILSLVKGKITSKYPYDVTKLFNWGAFLGTWIWGLMNKSYIPLLMLILFFTPFNFIFALICGFKGNEWAFKNGKYKDVKKFNKKQEKQTLFWSVFTTIFVPIIVIVASLIIGLIATKVLVSSPNAKENIAKMEQTMNNMSKSLFISYELSEQENKFYIDEKKWKYTSFENKKIYLNSAVNIAVYEKGKQYDAKPDELNITKIYGYNTGQLLAEFHFDYSLLGEKPDFSQLMKASMNAYKFYKVKD